MLNQEKEMRYLDDWVEDDYLKLHLDKKDKI